MVNTPHDPQHLNNQYASDAQSAETNSISGQEPLGKSLGASLGGNIRRTESGHVDVLHAIGGWRGLVENLSAFITLPYLLHGHQRFKLGISYRGGSCRYFYRAAPYTAQ